MTIWTRMHADETVTAYDEVGSSFAESVRAPSTLPHAGAAPDIHLQDSVLGMRSEKEVGRMLARGTRTMLPRNRQRGRHAARACRPIARGFTTRRFLGLSPTAMLGEDPAGRVVQALSRHVPRHGICGDEHPAAARYCILDAALGENARMPGSDGFRLRRRDRMGLGSAAGEDDERDGRRKVATEHEHRIVSEEISY